MIDIAFVKPGSDYPVYVKWPVVPRVGEDVYLAEVETCCHIRLRVESVAYHQAFETPHRPGLGVYMKVLDGCDITVYLTDKPAESPAAE